MELKDFLGERQQVIANIPVPNQMLIFSILMGEGRERQVKAEKGKSSKRAQVMKKHRVFENLDQL